MLTLLVVFSLAQTIPQPAGTAVSVNPPVAVVATASVATTSVSGCSTRSQQMAGPGHTFRLAAATVTRVREVVRVGLNKPVRKLLFRRGGC